MLAIGLGRLLTAMRGVITRLSWSDTPVSLPDYRRLTQGSENATVRERALDSKTRIDLRRKGRINRGKIRLVNRQPSPRSFLVGIGPKMSVLGKLSLTLRLLARILQAPHEPEKETCLMSVMISRFRLILGSARSRRFSSQPLAFADRPCTTQPLKYCKYLASSHLTADQHGRVLNDNQSTGS